MTKEKSYCPTCGHVIAKERTNLSSLEFRRLIHKIDTIEGLIDNKECLSRFIKSSYNKDFADQFLEDLKGKITKSQSSSDLDSIKLWLLGFINNENRTLSSIVGPPSSFREIALYKYLLEDFSDINMPFGEFYDCYAHWVLDDPMSKNRVSRALSAFGLKPVMRRIAHDDGRMKCTMVLNATEKELSALRQKNGL